MKYLSHEERIKHSNLMRAFCYDAIEEKDIRPWETYIWSSKWPELSEFLSNKDSIYGSTEEEYQKIMEQFNEVQMTFRWMIKAYYQYMRLYATEFGLKPPPSPAAYFIPRIVIAVVIVGVAVYLIAQ